ncbi:hypothetical protein DSO57_1016905 [Entomophthora muscae]|uniref:Uncharacterized protein n=1 Tax=Entomophthora muscae TaxID=34485 RepID=A0ACC2T4V7_9FUNG|nr:hypothetical protein DSO57_1016905 [Entomophthora muscae]
MIWLFLVRLAACEQHIFQFIVHEAEQKGEVRINQHLPGPTIHAALGDTVIVDVLNFLDVDLRMVWHGINQTPNPPGGLDLSQPPMRPKESITYTFEASKVGSFYYQAQTDFMLSGYGTVLVEGDFDHLLDISNHDPEYFHDAAVPIIISEAWASGQPKKDQPESFQINGKHKENYVLYARDQHNYLLHIIAATTQTRAFFWIEDHSFTVIMVDGTYIEPVDVDHVQIDPGQRIAVLIYSTQHPKNYFMYVQDANANAVSIGILRYDRVPIPYSLLLHKPTSSRTFPPSRWIEDQLKTSSFYRDDFPPSNTTANILLNITQDTLFHINRHDPKDTYSVRVGQDVQIVFQMYSKLNQACESTTWYLQGHSFHRVGSAEGTYDSSVLPLIDNYLASDEATTLLMDTFTHFPSDTLLYHEEMYFVETSKPPAGISNCGWYAIRFKATNPGLWSLESTILPHKTRGLHTKLLVHHY